MLDGMDRSLTWRAIKVIEAPLVDASTIHAPQHKASGALSDRTKSFKRARSVLVRLIYRSSAGIPLRRRPTLADPARKEELVSGSCDALGFQRK
jgi:hypothetical protein